MALPPRGDPRRPLHLAIRSTRVLGIMCLLFGTCAMIPMLQLLARTGGRRVMLPTWPLMVISLGYFVPGVLYIVFSVFLGQRRQWAVVGSIVISSIVGVLSLVSVIGLAIAMVVSSDALVMGIPLAVFGFCVLAIAQLIYHLAKSFEAIKYPPFGQEFRGFEPLPLAATQQVLAQQVFIGPGADVPNDASAAPRSGR